MHTCSAYIQVMWASANESRVRIGRATIIVHDPAAGVNMFYRVAAIHHLLFSDPTRVGDVTRIPCNAVPPDRGCRVNSYFETSFPIGRNGRGRVTGTAMKRQNSLKSSNIE
jgi:hypothetical protein